MAEKIRDRHVCHERKEFIVCSIIVFLSIFLPFPILSYSSSASFQLRLERSTDQVIKPINLEALSKWVGQIPADVVSEMAQIAPMLATLGYDPDANPPEYGKPDSFVVKKMNEIKEKASVWKEKEKELLKIRESIRQNILQDKNSPVVEVPADNPSDNEIAPDSSAANSKSAPGTS